jgi:hypothetical protein
MVEMGVKVIGFDHVVLDVADVERSTRKAHSTRD